MALILRRFAGRTVALARLKLAVSRLRFDRRTSIVLRYHALVGPGLTTSYASPGITLAVDRFDQQVEFLVSRYEVIDLDEAIRRTRAGRPPGSKPGVVLTFDDGYLDNYELGLPVLRRHGVTATIFVVAGAVHPSPPVWTTRLRELLGSRLGQRFQDDTGEWIELESPESAAVVAHKMTLRLRSLSATERERALAQSFGPLPPPGPGGWPRRMLNEDELRGLSAEGVTVGAHTVTHPLLPSISIEEARNEILASKQILEGILRGPVSHFSYPNPGSGEHHSPAVRELARAAGYRTASTSNSGLLRAGTDAFALPRFGVGGNGKDRLLFRALGERPRS